ncbi:MAG: hypothetical protein HY686_03255 [Chloroflexi bacterium]|nr:hypothetical protein [Chloroflexota bacterium]
MKKRQFEDILNDCLDRLARGEALNACLARYPQAAEELRPLLQVAWSAMRVGASVQALPQAQAATLQRLRERQEQRRARRHPGVWALPWLKPWAVATAALVVLAVAGWGTTAAAADTVPGDALYPVKLARERVTLAFVPSAGARARYYLRQAQARGEEMETAALRGKGSEALDGLAERVEHDTQRAVRLAGYEGPYPPVTLATPVFGLQEVKDQVPVGLSKPLPPPDPGRQTQQILSVTSVAGEGGAAADRAGPEPPPVLLSPSWRGKLATQGDLREMLREELKRHLIRQERLLQQTPPQARPQLQQALQRSRRHLEAALAALEAQPSETPRPLDRPGMPGRRGPPDGMGPHKGKP